MNAPITPPTAQPSASKPPRFVHLKVHSAYSLLEGALPIGKLAKLAEAHGYPALGLTDTNNLYGALEFSDKLSGAGIQPIVGVVLTVDFEDRRHDPLERVAPMQQQQGAGDGQIALLAMNEAGYANLMKVVTRAHFDAPAVEDAFTTIDVVGQHSEGLIALTGGPDGPIDRALREGQAETARARLLRLKELFGDRLYVEIQRHGLKSEADVEPQLLDLAYANDIPIVATNEAYFASPDDYEAHDALLCIAAGRYVVEDDRRRVTPEHDFKSADAMVALFEDLPEALDNTIEIAKRCAFRPRGKKPILPRFVAADQDLTPEEVATLEAGELRKQAMAGLDARLSVTPLAEGFTREDYDKRLDYELGVIERMKFPGYFLIVADFIKWSKSQGVPVGPGRGSGAGSLVAWTLTITDLDPLRFGLLFERFLNPERVSMPDFDIDFCQDRRDEVIRYVQNKYGHDRVAQIITHGKLQARAVLRDVGRVLQMPYGQVDRLCKLVPNNPANPVTLVDAIEDEPKLQEEIDNDPLVARLVEIATKLEGLYRHASTHAAGMVIGDRPLVELVPVTRDAKTGSPVTQFNWKLVEAAGLVKFDFLGLKTLTVLQKAVELVKRGRGIDIDLTKLGLEDKKSYELLARADTVGVFQLESTGMRESLKRLMPDRFEDIIAMVALYRPGPMDNIPTYIARKHGKEDVDYLHPMLEGILKETYGVIIYQEQVIQIAQVMGGYSLGTADLLRRAMGKKDKAEMARHQAQFVEGAVERGVAKQKAAEIFELVDKFAGYGFNKSHAAAYALVSYHTAYMKANFREEFLAASMTLDMSNTDKLAMFAAEARRSGITVKPPCVNASEVDFMSEAGKGDKPGAIRYSLAALKNIGAAAVATVVEERKENGSFKTLADFASRLSPKALNKRSIETLAAAGAFDGLEPNRALVAANVDQILELAQRMEQEKAEGQADFFSMGAASSGSSAGPTLQLRTAMGWTPMERLSHEFDAIGFYLSGHPLDQYEKALQKMGVRRYVDFEAATEKGATGGQLAGIVISARERRSAKGNKFAFGMFSDMTGQFEAVIFSDTLAASRDLLVGGTPVLLNVSAERDGDTVKMRVESLRALNDAVAALQSGLRVILDGDAVTNAKTNTLEQLKQRMKPGGKGEVRFVLRMYEHSREIEFVAPGRYDVSPYQAGLLAAVPGVVEVLEI
ncbi:DNA polymerase III alpha subunit [Hyphomicrobium sulfonivorans]|uniref:DNA polymerase III subunit alpha n=1 Tax=Hyphomicrobium sulfonivorans TaxID=121290 RepID=A0A120CWY9_HYPSL|nr:DNA polymerase III subunit alpha [Hyphomicrobium sulfonivorans]KWT70184.1 DNA polymerase III alpha subunit [Hyphomicrobium sulfonivorans]